jgi:uncharacterized membrane protein
LIAFLHSGHNFDHALAAAILFSRLGDVGSTYLATPNLALEANPIMKRFGWPLAWASLLICLVAYLDARSGVMILVASLLVTASNLSKAWAMRSLGEAGYAEYMTRVVRGSSRLWALGFVAGSSIFTAMVGALPIVFGDENTAGYWVGAGIVLYAVIVALYGSISILRLFARVEAEDAARVVERVSA